MKSDEIKGTLKEIRGKIRETWGELTDNDLERFKGKNAKSWKDYCKKNTDSLEKQQPSTGNRVEGMLT